MFTATATRSGSYNGLTSLHVFPNFWSANVSMCVSQDMSCDMSTGSSQFISYHHLGSLRLERRRERQASVAIAERISIKTIGTLGDV